MMTTSDNTAALFTVLMKIQKKGLVFEKTETDPATTRRFATLESVLAAVMPCLNKHKVLVVSAPSLEGLTAGATTRLLHVPSGQWIETTNRFPITSVTAASDIAGMQTIARRHNLQCLLNLHAADGVPTSVETPAQHLALLREHAEAIERAHGAASDALDPAAVPVETTVTDITPTTTTPAAATSATTPAPGPVPEIRANAQVVWETMSLCDQLAARVGEPAVRAIRTAHLGTTLPMASSRRAIIALRAAIEDAIHAANTADIEAHRSDNAIH